MNQTPPEFEALLRGVSFRPIEAKALVKDLELGTSLLLEREATNAFDENAIKVCWPEDVTHLGYVAKEVAAEIAPWMDRGWHFHCIVELRMSTSVVLMKITPIRADADEKTASHA